MTAEHHHDPPAATPGSERHEISCPHALGLAVTLVVAISTAISARGEITRRRYERTKRDLDA
jgi:hypothetical protein